MRIHRLDLEAYGSFTRESLAFRADARVHVVVGPNESGKSTRRAAVLDLLYEIPHQSAYAFKHGKHARIGACVGEGDERWEIVRRKGRGETLAGPDGAPVDRARLLAWTAGLDRDAYARLFSISQTELAAGAEMLLADAGSVASALYGAAAGGFDVRGALRALDEERGRIYTSKGKIPTLNAALAALQQTRDRRTAASVGPDAWNGLRTRIAELEARVAAAAEEIRTLGADEAALRTLLAVAPASEGLRNLAYTLAASDGCRRVPPDRAEATTATVVRLRADRARLAALDERIANRREESRALRADPSLLAAAEHVPHLMQGLGTVRQARGDLHAPGGLLAQRAAASEAIEAARTLAWPTASLEEIRLKRAVLERLPELRRLLGLHAACAGVRQSAAEKLSEARARLGREEAALAELGTQQPLGPLDAALAEIERDTRNDVELARVQREIAVLADGLAAELSALDLAFDDPLEIRGRTFPTAADAADLAARVEALEAEKPVVREALAHAGAAVAARVRLLAPLEAAGLADSHERLAQLRDERDRSLAELVRAVHDRAPADEAAIARHRRDVAAVDAYADRRFERAEDVAAATLHRTELAREHGVETEARARDAELGARRTALLDEWTAMKTQLPPSVRKPAGALEWLERARAAIARANDLATRRAEAASLRARELRLRATLHAAWPALDAGTPAFGALVGEARRARDACAERDAMRRATQERVLERRRDVVRAAGEDADAASALARRAERWEAETAPLVLPGLDDPESAGATLAAVESLLRAVELYADKDERVRGIERRDEAFLAEARACVLAAAPGCALEAARDPLATIERVCANIQAAEIAAREIEVRRENLERDLAERTALAAIVAELDGALAATCAELDLPPHAIDEALEAGRLRAARETTIAHAASEIRAATGREPAAVEEALRSIGGPAGARAAFERLQARLGARITARDELVAECGIAADVLARAEVSTDANLAHAEMAAIGAEIDREARRYAALTVASTMLAERMEAYAAEHQGPILASASTHLARLTGGRYPRVRIGADEKAAYLEVVDAAGDGKTVEALSEGTQDQLYLALRLATLAERLGTAPGPPLLLDDPFKNFDDVRTIAGIRAVAVLAPRVQIVYFSPRTVLADLAREALGGEVEILVLGTE